VDQKSHDTEGGASDEFVILICFTIQVDFTATEIDMFPRKRELFGKPHSRTEGNNQVWHSVTPRQRERLLFGICQESNLSPKNRIRHHMYGQRIVGCGFCDTRFRATSAFTLIPNG
jgi:hypothetical protein